MDPRVVMQIKSLELRARVIVEGFLRGVHRSPYHGFSVEFTEYRQYVPGDDLRYLDWRVFGRSDRYYVKRFEDETNLRCHILLDTSGSMGYGRGAYTKSEYTRTLAAALAYLLVLQRDGVGLVTFDDRVRQQIPPRYRPGQFQRILTALEKTRESGTTDLLPPLEQIAQTVKKRGLLILLSDMLAPTDALAGRLGLLTARRHEVVVIQVLDPSERELAWDAPAMIQDLETGRQIYVDPEASRQPYREELSAHCERVRESCSRLGITFVQLTTDQALELALFEFLRQRMRMQGTSRQLRRRSG